MEGVQIIRENNNGIPAGIPNGPMIQGQTVPVGIGSPQPVGMPFGMRPPSKGSMQGPKPSATTKAAKTSNKFRRMAGKNRWGKK